MKSNLLLALSSTLLCILAGVVVLRYVLPSFSGSAKLPEGASFESLDEFRKQMQQRDQRDVQADRSVSFRSIVQPNASDLIIYELQPNLAVKFQGVATQTNSHGMRSPEITKEKPENVVRIAMLGDSYAFGWGVEQDKIFAAVIEQIFNQDSSIGKKVEVLNFGVPGYSTFQQVAQFFDKGIEFSPDVVMVFFVDNDFGLPFFIKSLSDSSTLTSSNNFNDMKKKATNDEERKKASDLLRSINPNLHLARLARELEQRNVPVFFTMNPRRNSESDERRLPVLRRQSNIFYIPIKDDYLKIIGERGLEREQLTLARDPHPNALRHSIYGEIIAEKLADAVRKAANPGKQTAEQVVSQ